VSFASGYDVEWGVAVAALHTIGFEITPIEREDFVHFDSSSTLIRMKSMQKAAAGEVGPATAEPATPAGAAGMVVTFKGTGQSFPLEKGQTICELSEKHGIRLNVEDICGLSPGEHRLACMVRPKGAVEVEILG